MGEIFSNINTDFLYKSNNFIDICVPPGRISKLFTFGGKMRALKIAPFILALLLLLNCPEASAKANTVDLYINAVMTGNTGELEKILAPNFWYIGANGHIRDKEHFIEEIKNKKLIINRLTLSNERETSVGDTRLLTANGIFQGKSDIPLPDGLMRFSLVLANNQGQEQVTLFQATPVIPTHDCADGNCRIK